MSALPKIIARRCFNKAQRQLIVQALHGITPNEAKQVTIELDDHPMSLLGFRKPQQAHNLYYYLTGLPLFPDDFGEYKRRNGYRYADSNDYERIIPREADKAMRLYGHPTHAATLLEAQLETVKTNELDIPRFLYSVISELERRAQGETNYESRFRQWDHTYRLGAAIDAFGPPLTPIGQNAHIKKEV